jgi:hypothetical protein
MKYSSATSGFEAMRAGFIPSRAVAPKLIDLFARSA